MHSSSPTLLGKLVSVSWVGGVVLGVVKLRGSLCFLSVSLSPWFSSQPPQQLWAPGPCLRQSRPGRRAVERRSCNCSWPWP